MYDVRSFAGCAMKLTPNYKLGTTNFELRTFFNPITFVDTPRFQQVIQYFLLIQAFELKILDHTIHTLDKALLEAREIAYSVFPLP